MSVVKTIMDSIVDFIAKRKVAQLERAFRSNKELVQSIKDMDKAYEKIKDRMNDFCKKNPDACKSAQEARKRYNI